MKRGYAVAKQNVSKTSICNERLPFIKHRTPF